MKKDALGKCPKCRRMGWFFGRHANYSFDSKHGDVLIFMCDHCGISFSFYETGPNRDRYIRKRK